MEVEVKSDKKTRELHYFFGGGHRPAFQLAYFVTTYSTFSVVEVTGDLYLRRLKFKQLT